MSKRAALALAALGVVAVAVLGATVGYALIGQIRFGLELRDQPAALRLIHPLEVTAKVEEKMRITLDGIINAKVPFRQMVRLPLKGRYRTHFDLDTTIPLRFEVVYEGVLPVDTMAAIRAKTNFNYNDKKYLNNLGFATSLPMKLDIPVKLRVPVDEPVKFVYRGPLAVELDQAVDVAIDMEIPAAIRVAKDFVTPITSTVRVRLDPPRETIKVVINHADLSLRLATLRLEGSADPERGLRSESRWGPSPAP